MKRLLLLSTAAFTLASCTNYRYVQTGPYSHAAISPSMVTVYTSNAKVPKEHEEMGMIICKGSREYKSFKKAKRRAAAHGANGLYLMNSKENNILISRDVDAQEKDYNVLKGTDFTTKITFIAIYTNSPDAAVNTVTKGATQ